MATQRENKYYYKVNECPAHHASDEDCICWHEIGTGPLSDDEVCECPLPHRALNNVCLSCRKPVVDLEPFDPYKVTIGGELADPYRIAKEFGLDGAQTQALKKLLRNGHKHKTQIEDMREVVSTITRWLELNDPDYIEVEAKES